ncbi:hypothetical protein ACQ3G6_17255 [Allorhizobium undicola]|uniref:hypothetical protein n=1 Tax=Allorhizobium undicola TaxID=78527 RepID=UPI003D3294CA
MDDFETYLRGKETGEATLRQNWTYLQIFSYYGLKLPQDSDSLKALLAIGPNDKCDYSWFNAMHQTYAKLGQNSHYFINTVFKDVTDLGSTLKDFSKDASGDESLMAAVLDLLGSGNNAPMPDEDSCQAAIVLLQEMKERADAGAKLASKVKVDLLTYSAKLVEISGDVKRVSDAVDKDDASSEETVKKLQGDKGTDGSLLNMLDKLAADRREYEEDVKIAATTPTYGWIICPPIGLWAAAIVAGIYGKKATDMLATIENLEADIKTASESLMLALTTRSVAKLAHDSLAQVNKHLGVAIDKTKAVQNAWEGTSTGLNAILSLIGRTMLQNDIDQTVKLQVIVAVRTLVNSANRRWQEIRPVIDAMTDKPFISVNAEDMKLSDFLDKVKGEIAAKV